MSHSNDSFDYYDNNKVRNQFTDISYMNDNENKIFNSLMKIKSTVTPSKNMLHVPHDAGLVERIYDKPTTIADSHMLSTGKTKRSHSQTVLCATIEALKDKLIAKQVIPIYLQSTSVSFQNLIQQANLSSMLDINMDDLRHIAFLMHQHKKLALEKSLWSTFLKCGMGILKTKEVSVKLWPELLQNMIRSCHEQQNVNEIVTDEVCFSVAYSLLRNVEHRYQYYQDKLNERKKNIFDFQNRFQCILEKFIQDHLQPMQIDYQYRIALITSDYEDQRLAYEIERLQQQKHMVDEYQKAIIERLCFLRYKLEIAKFDIHLFELHAKEGQLPEIFDPIDLPFPSYAKMIQDETQAQQYIDQHQQILKNYKQEMILLFLNMSKVYMSEIQALFNKEMYQFWQNQRLLPVHERFTPVVLNLIEERFANRAEKAKYVYQHQVATKFNKNFKDSKYTSVLQ